MFVSLPVFTVETFTVKFFACAMLKSIFVSNQSGCVTMIKRRDKKARFWIVSEFKDVDSFVEPIDYPSKTSAIRAARTLWKVRPESIVQMWVADADTDDDPVWHRETERGMEP